MPASLEPACPAAAAGRPLALGSAGPAQESLGPPLALAAVLVAAAAVLDTTPCAVAC